MATVKDKDTIASIAYGIVDTIKNTDPTLLRFINKPGVYIRFTNDQDKHGLNPNYGWDISPWGVYGVPFTSKILAEIYAGDSAFKHRWVQARSGIIVYRVKAEAKAHLLRMSRYTLEMFHQDLLKMAHLGILSKEAIVEAKAKAQEYTQHADPGKKIRTANFYRLLWKLLNPFSFILSIDAKQYRIADPNQRHSVDSTAYEWRERFLRLGYTGLHDDKSKLHGGDMPNQVVFFSEDAYEVLWSGSNFFQKLQVEFE